MKRYKFVTTVDDLDEGDISFKWIVYATEKQIKDDFFWDDFTNELMDNLDEAREELINEIT